MNRNFFEKYVSNTPTGTSHNNLLLEEKPILLSVFDVVSDVRRIPDYDDLPGTVDLLLPVVMGVRTARK